MEKWCVTLVKGRIWLVSSLLFRQYTRFYISFAFYQFLLFLLGVSFSLGIVYVFNNTETCSCWPTNFCVKSKNNNKTSCWKSELPPTCILFLDVITHAFTFFRYTFGFTFNFNSTTKLVWPAIFASKLNQIEGPLRWQSNILKFFKVQPCFKQPLLLKP